MIAPRILVCVPLLMLAACSSLSEKSSSPFAETLPGLGGLDTVSKEDKEDDAWFKSFYGTNHCGVWSGTCASGAAESSGSGGGPWSVGPSEGASGHTDSGHSN